MSNSRATLLGSAGHVSYGATPLLIPSLTDISVEEVPVKSKIVTSLYGEVDEVYEDLIVVGKLKPQFFDTAQKATLFPYIGALTRGLFYPPAGADTTCIFWGSNQDKVTFKSALIGKMPDLTLGVTDAPMGEMEIWGVIPDSTDATSAASYFSLATGAYTAPAVATTASTARQEFACACSGGLAASLTDFGAFSPKETIKITHQLQLEAVKCQGRTRAFRLKSYRCMAQMIPIGLTMADIDNALVAQGAGAYGGSLASQSNLGNLVMTGAQGSLTVTVGNVSLQKGGYNFSNQALRVGEIGFISTYQIANGVSLVAPLAIAGTGVGY